MLGTKERNKFASFGMGVVGLSLMLIGTTASAFQLDFNIKNGAGKIDAEGSSGGTVVGAGLNVNSVSGTGMPSNNGVTVNIIGGQFNFTSGNYTSATGNTWFYGGGGVATLTGSLDLTGDLVADTGPLTILTGSFMGGNTTNITAISGLAFTGGFIINTVADDLVTYYGLSNTPPVQWTASFNASTTGTLSGTTFTGTAGGVSNAGLVNVPEPLTSALLGIGALILLVATRRRRRNLATSWSPMTFSRGSAVAA